MSFPAWMIIFFLVLCFLVLLVYVLVVKAFYWGDKKKSPEKNEKRKAENEK